MLAVVLLLGEVAIEVLSNDLQELLRPYRIYVWLGLGLAFVAAILMAVRESRASDDLSGGDAPSDRNISAGKVKGSIFVTGDKNVIADRTKGDVFRGDKITDGDVVHGDKHIHIQHAEIPALSALHQLPAPPRDFTGRSEEIEELLREMENGVTISGLRGLGGVGKTALALKVADLIKGRYPDAQFYLELKGVSEQPLTPAEAMAHVCRAYNLEAKLPDQERELSAIYNSVLNGKRALLLMDNAKDRAQVEPLIPPAGCALIVTSRQHFTLPGLYDKDLDALPAADARELLLKIARRIGDHADEIAKLCGWLPLALRVAASAIAERKNLSPADYSQRLSDEKQRLSHLKEVDVAFSLSCQMLGEERFALWRKLAVFPSTFDDSAASAVWEMEANAAKDALADLLAYSLIEYDEETDRYSLHDLARIFGDGRLSESERDLAKRHHAMHYCQVLNHADEFYLQGGAAVTHGLALFDRERENIDGGWACAAAEIDRDEQVSRLCIAYPSAGSYVLELRHHPTERIRWMEVMLVSARRLKQRWAEGDALGNLGNAYADLGETRKAIEYHEQHLAICRETGDRQREGRALGNLGVAYSELGETRKAIEYYEQALVIAREIGDSRFEGSTLGNLGVAYKDLGETPKAIEYQERRLLMAREIGDRRGEGNALNNLGTVYSLLDERRKAIEYHEQHLAIARETGDRRGEGHALGNLGVAYFHLGETRKAMEYYEKNLAIVRETGDLRGEGNTLWNISLGLDQLGGRELALVNAEAALGIFEQMESPNAEKVRRRLAEWRAAPKQ